MSKCKIVDTGLIYKNPKPHVKSIHAYFPSVVTMDNGEMLATVVLGEAFEALNNRTYIFRSKDNGKSWDLEGKIQAEKEGKITSNFSRLTYLGAGELVIFMIRSDRTEHPEEGLTNPETLGFVPTELLLLRSTDYGHSWKEPELIEPPLIGPAFEICCPIVVLSDGKWIIPTSTWHDWDGRCPNGLRMIGLISYDNGRSWPEYMNVMYSQERRIYFWESKIVELKDGRLLAAAWVYDDNAKSDRPNHYAISSDGGRTWSKPKSMGIMGQTLTLYVLESGKILCVYRRTDKQGLWAIVCRVEGNELNIDGQWPLWGYGTEGLIGRSENMSHNFNVLKFGAPCITETLTGELFVAFWCYEECISVIRWIKVSIDENE